MVTEDKPGQRVRLKIVVLAPPPGVHFAVQRGRSDLLAPLAVAPPAGRTDATQFELTLRLGPPLADGAFNFLGEYAQGSPADRFVYLNSGTLAGQVDSVWSRRAKLKLASIPRPLVDTAAAIVDAVIEAHVVGTMKDGGPVCASVKPDGVAWRLVQNAA